MDPKPQPHWEMSELERRLLEAARMDRVPRELGARMAQALGVQAGASSSVAPAASDAAGTAGAPLFAKAGLWGVLSQLDASLVEVFVLFDIEGFSTKEIASALELPGGTVASRLRRARDEFRAAAQRVERVMHREEGGR